MTKDRITSKQIALLLASISGVGLLSSCATSELSNPFTSDVRPEQYVPGDRHAPILNVYTPGSTPADKTGAPVLLGEKSAPVSTTPFVTSNINDNTVRKSIPGNSNISADANTSSSITPQMAPDSSASKQPPVMVEAPVVLEAGSKVEEHKASPNVEAAAQDDGTPAPWRLRDMSVSLPVMNKGNKEAAVNQEAVEEPESSVKAPVHAENNGKTPQLSSVPETPQAFKDIKAGNQQNMDEMQAEHAKAEQDRNALIGEPSQMKAAPVTMPQAVEQQPSAAPSSGAPRRGVDIMTQEEWNAFQKAQQDKTPAPQTAPAGADANSNQPGSAN